jgi:ribokinase
MTGPALTVVGSINLDLVATGDKLPAPGETVTGASFAQHPGGKGANQALAARRLGADVSMVARTGSDANRDAALALLEADGVDLSGVSRDDEYATGVALIAVDKDGENQIVVASGANGVLSPEVINFTGRPDAILCQLEVPVSCVMAAARAGTDLFAVNLAPALPVPVGLLEEADLLIVNQGEADFYGESLHRGRGMVALTLGGQGSVLYQGGKEIARAPVFTVPVIDTTGAGDTFSAALVVALAGGQAPGDALRFASAASALAVTTAGAQPGLPRREAVEALLAEKS